MQKLRFTRVVVKDTDKAGNPLKDKKGKPFFRVGVLVDDPQFKDKWLSCLAYSGEPVLEIKVGDERTVVVEQKGDFLNFRLPSRIDLLEERITVLEYKVNKTATAPVQEPNPDDIPF